MHQPTREIVTGGNPFMEPDELRETEGYYRALAHEESKTSLVVPARETPFAEAAPLAPGTDKPP